MAKRERVADDGTEQVTANETKQMIPAKQLKSLLKAMATCKKQQTQIAGELGSEIKTAIERYGCNRKVLRLVHTLDRLENEQIADFLDEFNYMLEASGVGKRAESAPRFSGISNVSELHTEAAE